MRANLAPLQWESTGEIPEAPVTLQVIVICLLLAPSAGEPTVYVASRRGCRKQSESLQKGHEAVVGGRVREITLMGAKQNLLIIYFLEMNFQANQDTVAIYCENIDI